MDNALTGMREGALLKYSSTAQNPIDANVVGTFERGVPQVLLPFTTAVRSPGVAEVSYTVGGMTELAVHLRSVRDWQGVCEVLVGFKQLIESCAGAGLPLKNLELEYDRVFYDPKTRALRFVYLPFAGIIPDVNKVRAFFEGIPSHMQVADGDAASLISSYSQYFASSSMFNPVDFASTLGALCTSPRQAGSPAIREVAANADSRTTNLQVGGIAGQVIHDRPQSSAKGEGDKVGHSGTAPEKGAHARVDPGTTVLGALTFDFSPTPDGTEVLGDLHLSKSSPSASGEDESGEAVGRIFKEPAVDKPDLEPKPESEPEPASEPAPESAGRRTSHEKSRQKEEPPARTYWLHHRATDENVRVTGDRFVVGKSKYSTYQVRHTTTVSRSHAIFSCDEGGCWIEDDGSRNGTYLDNRRLEPHVKEQLKDGMVIRMSDEEFTFSEKASE